MTDIDVKELQGILREQTAELDSYRNPASCSGDNFIVWKKEICSLHIEGEEPTEFTRLEFQEIWDQDVVLDWLEPVIHKGEPALILHCHRK